MHRQKLLRLIEGYSARHPEEAAVVGEFREFVQTHENCFERSLEVGHITGSAWIVDQSGERTLLTHHRKLDLWLQLGGHADGEPDPHKVAMTEAEEESGLVDLGFVSESIFDLDIHTIPARKNEPEHLHLDVRFAIRHTGDGVYQVSEESHDLAWVPVAEIESFTEDKSVCRMAKKWLESGARV